MFEKDRDSIDEEGKRCIASTTNLEFHDSLEYVVVSTLPTFAWLCGCERVQVVERQVTEVPQGVVVIATIRKVACVNLVEVSVWQSLCGRSVGLAALRDGIDHLRALELP